MIVAVPLKDERHLIWKISSEGMALTVDQYLLNVTIHDSLLQNVILVFNRDIIKLNYDLCFVMVTPCI